MAAQLRPTESETEILSVIWRMGESTVRDVYEAVHAERGTGYTTTLKLMQLMLEKGLLQRNDERRPHVYKAVEEPARTQGAIVGRLIDRVFDGSASALVQRALDGRRLEPGELAAIRAMIDSYDSDAPRRTGK